MKELIKSNVRPEIELSVEKKVEVEKYKFDGQLLPKPNQRVFKLNVEKGEVSECEYFDESDTIDYFEALSSTPDKKSILVEEGFDYVIKLNKHNAIKYFENKFNKKVIYKENIVTLRKTSKVDKFRNY